MLTDKQKERYSRQIISSSIGEEGQEKLMELKVLQIGAGGLGSPCALFLVAAGIGNITIIDNDTVSLSNLQRQILYREKEIGKVKVEMAKISLSELNSEVNIQVFKTYFNGMSADKYLSQGYDFIIDCSDNMHTKFFVNQMAIKYNIKCVIAGIKDFYGQIITIDPKTTACYQCVFPEPEDSANSSDEEPLPVIGVTPGVLGSLEANEVIKTALGLSNLFNSLLMVNLLTMSFNKIKVVKDENCVCSK
ncbi:MAG: adenylyltransferase [Candidatus Lokiarchaeota archaeon]|nr:adenylyltransferase [Candidatus Lokiarchaeota archaeon]MBD3339890.1 adenylyltransferase [Candidatus Lokiarchaeota archaeon]